MRMVGEKTSEEGALTYAIIGAAIEVHRTLGPGFPESIYERAFCVELRTRGIVYTQQVAVQVMHKDIHVGTGRIDLLVSNAVTVELKAVDAISPVHIAQTLSYSRMTGHQLGLIFNFNVRTLKYGGIERVALSP